jgi:oxygen-independent coproporphyrinogen III oxidase
MMAGIYIHIPFCKQQCTYCDFHFSTLTNNKNELLDSLVLEMEIRKPFVNGANIKTIYFGGGTPSILSYEEIMRLFDGINKNYHLENDIEITLEANPDDLTNKKIQELKNTPINRFSIGVQSFHEADLKYMNRAHNVTQAFDSIKNVQDAGWQNITVDLIYGTPSLNNQQWQENLNHVIDLGVPHLSAYSLTVEEKTPLYHSIKTGKEKPLDERKSQSQFNTLIDFMPKNGFEQYEISNFAKSGFIAKHNSSYWKGDSYLGLGPSAHSFNTHSRYWNVSNNALYIKSLQKGELNIQQETLTEVEQYNEYILTSLRTVWGCNLDLLEVRFSSFLVDFFKKTIKKWKKDGKIEQKDQIFKLTKNGKMIADLISSDLFYID